MPAESSVIGVFDCAKSAEQAARTLLQNGFDKDKLSVVGKSEDSEKLIRKYVSDPDRLKEMVTAGLLSGGLFGFLVGVAAIWVPGIGALLVAGPLSAAIMAGLEGAAAGAIGLGVVSGLISLGMEEEQAHEYSEMVKQGKYLLIFHGDPEETQRAHDILAITGPEELDVHEEYV
jgi:uncharacterized membrane protein